MVKEVDVAIIGGSFSGSSAGILLKRANPNLNILVIEKKEKSDRKVGESTSEVAGCFLTKVLGLSTYLAREHLTKYGLRLWFNSPGNDCFSRCAEVGAYYQTRLPTFQIDRSKLDPKLLSVAEESGCEIWKPATISEIELGGLGNNTLGVKINGETRAVKAKWVIDASGKAAFLARRMKMLKPLDTHPTNSVWARFKNVGDLDSWELRNKFSEYAEALPSSRAFATNHLMGYGWWCWIIPLADGDVSAGLTYDTRLFSLPDGDSLGERLHHHLLTHPVGRELFQDAQPIENDTRTYSGLAYYSEKVMGDGWAIAGDAGGFMDPLYSQGLDYCAHTVYNICNVIKKNTMGNCVAEDIADYNRRFEESYFRWYEALYRDKYYYLGDGQLMKAAFLLDIATYFMGPVRLVYSQTEMEFSGMPYNGKVGGGFAKFMCFYNRRLSAIARKRHAAGIYGENNTDWRYLVKQGFSPDSSVVKLLLKGIATWWKAELQTVFLTQREPDDLPTSITAGSKTDLETSVISA